MSGNEQLDEVLWQAMDAAMNGDEAAVLAAVPRIRMAMADLPTDAAKKAETMAEYDRLAAEFVACAAAVSK